MMTDTTFAPDKQHGRGSDPSEDGARRQSVGQASGVVLRRSAGRNRSGAARPKAGATHNSPNTSCSSAAEFYGAAWRTVGSHRVSRSWQLITFSARSTGT